MQRAAKFAKYLPEFGIEPGVVTRAGRENEDPSLLTDVAGVVAREAAHIPFQRLRARGSGQTSAHGVAWMKRVRDWLQLPDHAVTWVPFAIRCAQQWHAEQHFDAVFSTSPYHSTHLAALALKRRFGWPWIADFRDPWITDQFTHYPTTLHQKLNAHLERAVLQHADHVTVISQAMANDFAARWPKLAARVEVIYNGFDPVDFAALTEVPTGPPWVLRHIGTLYPDRKPDAFFHGLRRFLGEHPQRQRQWRIEFYGQLHADVRARLTVLRRDLDLTNVNFQTYVPHAEAVKLMRSSHALLLLPGPGSTTVTGKVFEYLAAGRPILAAAPHPSGIDEIFDRLGPNAAIRVADEPAAIAAGLANLESTLMRGEADRWVVRPEEAARFSRRAGAARLAEIVCDCVNTAARIQ